VTIKVNIRKFKYSDANTNNLLVNNHPFLLSKRHALKHFKTGAIYSFIPKNACSTMRFSLAIENGSLSENSNVNWIHSNNTTFNASLNELYNATYTFVILRCPYRRLVSSFLDKIVSKKNDAWIYESSINYEINIDDLTSQEFVKHLKKRHVLKSNIHWRPQTDFLLYEGYDDYFCLEDFEAITTKLESKLNFKVIDTRAKLNHNSSKYATNHYDKAYNPSVKDIYFLKMNNELPLYESFYNEEILGSIKNIYSKDFEVYRHHLDHTYLLFAD